MASKRKLFSLQLKVLPAQLTCCKKRRDDLAKVNSTTVGRHHCISFHFLPTLPLQRWFCGGGLCHESNYCNHSSNNKRERGLVRIDFGRNGLEEESLLACLYPFTSTVLVTYSMRLSVRRVLELEYVELRTQHTQLYPTSNRQQIDVEI